MSSFSNTEHKCAMSTTEWSRHFHVGKFFVLTLSRSNVHHRNSTEDGDQILTQAVRRGVRFNFHGHGFAFYHEAIGLQVLLPSATSDFSLAT